MQKQNAKSKPKSGFVRGVTLRCATHIEGASAGDDSEFSLLRTLLGRIPHPRAVGKNSMVSGRAIALGWRHLRLDLLLGFVRGGRARRTSDIGALVNVFLDAVFVIDISRFHDA